MEVMKHLHMNGGVDEKSYSANSLIQKKVLSITKPIIEEAMRDILSSTSTKIAPVSTSILRMADLGCSSGPNTLLVISYVTDIVYTECQQWKRASPEFLVFINDLPSNDFNTIFKSLPSYYDKLKENKGDDFGPCCVAGVPGSFYGRLFPSESLHFVHASYSLHWLSQVPQGGIESVNKGNIYMAKFSPPSVINAYFDQYQKDFSLFFRSRSVEIVSGGRMVLTLLGRRSADPCSKECCYFWELLAVALNEMVSEGMIEEEKLDSFDLPHYMPSPTEIKAVIKNDGSFVVNRLETFDVHWDVEYGTSDVFDKFRSSTNTANTIRAVTESLLVSHFGEGMIDIDEVFRRYREIVEDRMSRGETTNYINVVVSMTRV